MVLIGYYFNGKNNSGWSSGHCHIATKGKEKDQKDGSFEAAKCYSEYVAKCKPTALLMYD
jgi:hypothetical protein